MNQSQPAFNSLQARWTHPEREAIVKQADKLNRGDVSGWARATHGASRPEVAQQRHQFRPISSIKAVSNLALAKAANDIAHANAPKAQICLPAEDWEDARTKRIGEDARKAFELSHKLHKFYAKRVRKHGPAPIVEPEQPAPTNGLLDDCPKADITTIAKVNMERSEVVSDPYDTKK